MTGPHGHIHYPNTTCDILLNFVYHLLKLNLHTLGQTYTNHKHADTDANWPANIRKTYLCKMNFFCGSQEVLRWQRECVHLFIYDYGQTYKCNTKNILE